MSPRAYRAGQRGTANAATRGRIVDAARQLLSAPEEFADFTLEAVARRAGLSRMTVYYQFGSRSGLLEAILDDLAGRGGMEQVPSAMQEPTAARALAALIAAFSGFWASHRLLIRRLRAMAVLDPELSGVFRDARRRSMLAMIAKREQPESGSGEVDDLIDLLTVLTSFETYDALAGSDSDEGRVVGLLQQTAATLMRRSSAIRGATPGRQRR
jgi:AcrR family transcriptional regulator